jgi:hypothetical protein
MSFLQNLSDTRQVDCFASLAMTDGSLAMADTVMMITSFQDYQSQTGRTVSFCGRAGRRQKSRRDMICLTEGQRPAAEKKEKRNKNNNK